MHPSVYRASVKADPFGRYYTSGAFSRLLVSQMPIAAPRIVLDLGAGSGALARAATERWTAAQIVTVDSDKAAGLLSKQINNRNHVHVTADVLDPHIAHRIALEFGDIDAAVCNPPFIRPKWRKRFGEILEAVGLSGVFPVIKEVGADVLFIAQNLRLLRNGGNFGVVVPAGLVSGEKHKKFREWLANRHQIEQVIELPRTAFHGADAQTYILLLKKSPSNGGSIRLSGLSDDGHIAVIGSAGVAPYTSITVLSGFTSTLDTAKYFDKTYSHGDVAPIDHFFDNADALNKLYLGSPSLSRELGTLLLLGYMSAVESYLRAITRRLINVDEVAQANAELRMVTFGAAIHHSRELLPEALLDSSSLAGEHNVLELLREILGIKGQHQELQNLLAQFGKVCELRHCCVHRFGLLGAKNAIALGISQHRPCLEKPLDLQVADIEEISLALRTVVKGLNNYIFRSVLDRTAKNKDEKGRRQYTKDWTWDYRKDKARFATYYKLFASENDAIPSPNIKAVYDSFRSAKR